MGNTAVFAFNRLPAQPKYLVQMFPLGFQLAAQLVRNFYCQPHAPSLRQLSGYPQIPHERKRTQPDSVRSPLCSGHPAKNCQHQQTADEPERRHKVKVGAHAFIE